jgi:hypothetical protein
VSADKLTLLFTPAVIKPAKDLTGPEKVVSYERIRPSIFVTSAEPVTGADLSQNLYLRIKKRWPKDHLFLFFVSHETLSAL